MKKRILALGLAITMVMPMTAMAGQKPLQTGVPVEITTHLDGTGIRYTEIFNVMDAATFYNMGNDGTRLVPAVEGVHKQCIQAAVASMGAEYDTYYIGVVQQTSRGTAYGLSGVTPGIEVNGQRFTSNDGNPDTSVTVDTSGRWWSEAEKQALYATGGTLETSGGGKRWPITINGQTYQVVYLQSTGGAIWIVPKAATSVRVLFAQIASTGIRYEALNGASMGYTDYDNAYYIDLKTGATPASSQTWVSDASGWRVQRSDGSYLTNEWYQSNGLWYYMGADGYMLTNTTTPDGYPVNADGVWVQ